MLDDLVEDLKDDEGWRPFAYRDHLGFLTIGYGFLIDERKTGRLPEAIGEQWLLHAASERWNQLVSRAPWVLDQPDDVQRALGNMVYQLGVDGLLNFRKMLDALQAGQRPQAAAEALDSKWAKQTPNRAHRVAWRIAGQ